MERELEHFRVDGAYGWNQDWFTDPMMRLGGCAAVTACDSCVYFALRLGKTGLVPFDPENVTRRDYLALSRRMKRVLGPRMRGVDKLETYQEGFAQYLQSIGERWPAAGQLHGSHPYAEAERTVISQIDSLLPVPFLLLHHKDPALDFYVWHWFLLMGYQRRADSLMVKAVTYGSWRWLNLRRLWDTGFTERGGMILFSFP